jgi:hypothetical protein
MLKGRDKRCVARGAQPEFVPRQQLPRALIRPAWCQHWALLRCLGWKREIAAVLEHSGFAVFDLLDAWSSVPPEELQFDPKDSHPNALGHVLSARAMARFVAEHPELLEPR